MRLSCFTVAAVMLLSGCLDSPSSTGALDVSPGQTNKASDAPDRSEPSGVRYTLSLTSKSAASVLSLPEYAEDVTIVQGINVFDVDGDGSNEVFICGTTYRDYVDHPVTVLSVKGGRAIDATATFFGSDIPNSNQCTGIFFTDLNADGLKDVVFTDAGMDDPPWTGTAIEVALNNGSGFRRITDQFEEQTRGIRAYSVAAGQLDSDPYGEIILSSGTDATQSQVLQFNGDQVSIGRNKWAPDQWWDVNNATNMQVVDLDGDGRDDLYVGGNWASPSNRVFWSGLRAGQASVLPDTPIGHYSGNFQGDRANVTGVDITSTAIADFDNDGDLDIVNVAEHVSGRWTGSEYDILYGDSFLQVLSQTARRRFQPVRQFFESDFGHRYYLPAMVADLNNDARPDVILNYWRKAGNWRSDNMFSATILLNLGGMSFQKVEASDLSGYDRTMKGMIFPIEVSGSNTRVLILQPRSGRADFEPRRLTSYEATLVSQ